MKKHLLCLTLDTDPDGLSGKVVNRRALQFDALARALHLPDELGNEAGKLGQVPITWFVRADGQLESVLGTARYLLEKYDACWKALRKSGHELGWHPHLYRQKSAQDEPRIIRDPAEAREELERLQVILAPDFAPTAFRNGEGWHSAETFATIERLGFLCDSTAMPGRAGGPEHLVDWQGAPNQPYFPRMDNLCSPGPERSLLELPMNTWRLKAPYDREPRIRYMNPAVRRELFLDALGDWADSIGTIRADLYVWVLIFHPDEVFSTGASDLLYSFSSRTLCDNLVSLVERLQGLGHEFEWMTVSSAAERWKNHWRGLVA